MSTIVLVAFEVYADDMEDAQQQLMNKLLPNAPFPRRYTGWLDSWWIAMDERYDDSDLESAVFIPHGISQKDARAALNNTTLTEDCCPPCRDGEHAGDMERPGTCDCCGQVVMTS